MPLSLSFLIFPPTTTSPSHCHCLCNAIKKSMILSTLLFISQNAETISSSTQTLNNSLSLKFYQSTNPISTNCPQKLRVFMSPGSKHTTMDAGVFGLAMFILLSILISDTGIATKPPTENIYQIQKLSNEENEIYFTSSNDATELDAAPGTIPIVNPTTPTTTTPIINPGSPPPPMVTGPITNPTPASGGAWCIANPNASPTALQVALDYACGYGGADCSGIQPGSSCYDPNTVKDHASYAFNDYYQKNPIPTSCVFGGTAQLTYTDPSYGNCHFASTTKTPTTTPTPTIPTTTPSTTTPVNPYSPSGPTGYGSEPTDYGSEPTGTPSSAETISYNLQLFLVMTCLTLWIPASNLL